MFDLKKYIIWEVVFLVLSMTGYLLKATDALDGKLGLFPINCSSNGKACTAVMGDIGNVVSLGLFLLFGILFVAYMISFTIVKVFKRT